MEIVSAIITGGFALFAAIWSRRASNSAKRASNSAELTHKETQHNGGNDIPIEDWDTTTQGPSIHKATLADMIHQLGRRLVVMDERSERTERKVDQLTEDHRSLRTEVRAMQEKQQK